MQYLFILGRTTDLCRVELETVLKAKKVNYKLLFSQDEIFQIETSKEIDHLDLIKTLGGTIKIAQVISDKKISDKGISETIISFLAEKKTKVDFGISAYGELDNLGSLGELSKQVKEELEKKGIKARFVLPKEGTSISSVVVKKQNLKEIIICNNTLFKTLEVQDFEDWGKRDFERPCADAHSGMIPPKVARMMVNLGSWRLETGSLTLLDPFCGVGTILAEAMMRGYDVIGCDISQTAVEKSKKNLKWLIKQYQISNIKYQIFENDATHISEKLAEETVDAIVTEPYLGPNESSKFKVQSSNLKNIITGLEKLYIGCLREWRKILKPEGTVVIALPSFMVAGREFFVKKVIDKCENFGYTLIGGPYQYFRPQAVVKRNIYILRFKGLKV